MALIDLDAPVGNLIDLDTYEPPQAEPRGNLRAIGDTAVQFGKGAVTGVRMLSDVFGADNAVSGGLRSATEALDGLLSASAKQDQRRVAEILQEAEGKGWMEQIGIGLKAAGVAPGALLAQAAGTAVPTIAASMLPGVGQAGLIGRLGMAAGVGAAQGGGVIKGSIYETTKDELLKAGASEEEAEARAVQAQEYGGPNTGQIAMGAGIGALAGSTGLERAAAALRAGVTRAPAGIIGRTTGGAATEAVPEFVQGGQEKFATNTALANEGFDVDPMSGVVAGATLEGVAGAGLGAAFGVPAPRVAVQPGAALPSASQTTGMPSSIDAAGQQFQDLGIRTPAEDMAAQKAMYAAGRQWQDLGITTPAEDLALQKQAVTEADGAAASRARDARLAAIGNDWKALGVTQPADDLQAQRSGMRAIEEIGSAPDVDSAISAAIRAVGHDWQEVAEEFRIAPPAGPALDERRRAGIIATAGQQWQDLAGTTGVTSPEESRALQRSAYTLAEQMRQEVENARQAANQAGKVWQDIQSNRSATIAETGLAWQQLADAQAAAAKKEAELDALQSTGTGQYGIPIEARTAVEQAAALEAPTAMQLAMQRAKSQLPFEKAVGQTPESPATPVAEPLIRESQIPDTAGTRLDGAPFKTLNGAELRRKANGQTDTHDIVPLDGGFVVRPKPTQEIALAQSPKAIETIQKQQIGPAAVAQGNEGGIAGQPAASAPVEADIDGTAPPAVDQRLTPEQIEAKAAQVMRLVDEVGGTSVTPDQVKRLIAEKGIGAADITIKRLEETLAQNKRATAIGDRAAEQRDQRLVPVSKRITAAEQDHIGRDSVPLSDGGKPFKTNLAAKEAKKNQPMLRVVRVDGGFALAPKTDAQIAAQEKNAKRLAVPRFGNPVVPLAAHEFIAARGGLRATEKSDMGMEGNTRVGNRFLFGSAGIGMDEAAEYLKEAGYLPDGASHDDARNLIKRSLANPQYTPEGAEQMAEREMDERRKAFEDEQEAVALAQEAEDNELDIAVAAFERAMLDMPQGLAQSDMDMEDALLVAGYTRQEIENERNEAERAEVDQGAVEAAAGPSPQGDRGREGAQGEDSPAGGQSEGLTAPTRADVLAQQAQAEAEAKRKEQGGDKPLPSKPLTGDVPDMFNTQASVFDQPATQAATILDAANVTGKDRLDILKDVKSGALTPGEVQAAYPDAKPAEPAVPDVVPMPPVATIPIEVGIAAHSGTSFSPERRGRQEQETFTSTLEDAWNRAAKAAGTDQDAIDRITEVFSDVADGYRARFMAALGARSRVMSTMITGGGNFPVARNQKRLDIERRRSEEANQYLERGIKRLMRAARGPIDNSPEAELERVRLNLSQREEAQTQMKAANVALRQKDDDALSDIGFTDTEIAALKKPDFAGRTGFPNYKLTNNNAEIRRLRERLADAEKRVSEAAAGPVETTVRKGVRIEENAQDDRIRMFFDEKPSEAIRTDLKASGFKWSPNAGAWQRQLTDNARAAANRVVTQHFPEDDAGNVAMFARGRPGQSSDNAAESGERNEGRQGGNRVADGVQPAAGPEQDVPTTVGGKPAPRGWAGATRISRAGSPITVYRGAASALQSSHFAVGALGRASGNPSSGLGVWFTTGQVEAKGYGKSESFQLDIRNPKLIQIDDLPGFDSVDEANQFREDLRSQGFDGIIISARSLGKRELHIVAFDADQVIRPPADAALARSPFYSALSREVGKINAKGKQTEQQRLNVQRVQAIVDASKIRADVQVVATPSDLPVEAPADARGLYYNGAIYVVASNNRTAADVHRTIAHEAIGHHGLRAMLGRDGWKQMMNQIQFAIKAGNKELKSISDYIRRTYVDEDGNFNLTPGQEADEIAAKSVEDGVDPVTGEFRPGFGFLKSVFARVARFLRDMGIPITFTNMELQGMLIEAQRGLRRGNDEIAVAARSADEIAPGAEFWRKIKDGESFTKQELTDAYSIGRAGTTRTLSGLGGEQSFGPARAAEVAAKWSEAIAGFDGYSTSGRDAGDGAFFVDVVPDELAETTDGAIVSFRFTSIGDGAYQADVLDPAPESSAFAALQKNGRIENTGQNDPNGRPYYRVKLDNPKTEARALMQEAVRRLALHIGKTPTVFEEQRDTGATAGKGITRTRSHGFIERHFARKGDQTDSPAFKKWFGNSAVVDKDGRPLVVYHGTEKAGFASFDPDMQNSSSRTGAAGFYFTNHKLGAETYSGTRKAAEIDPEMFDEEGGTPGNYAVYLSIKNPLVIDMEGRGWNESPPDGSGFEDHEGVNELAEYASDTDHDGLIVKNVNDEGRHGQGYGWGDTTYVAFQPTQIKSATGNQGTFDPDNADIRFARSAVTGQPLPQTWQGPDASKLDDFLYSMQDKYIDTKRVVTAVRQAIGGIADNLDPYLQEELYHGRAAMATKEFLENGIRPLLTDMQARGIEMSDFEEYLHNRHAERRNVQVAKVNPGMQDGGSGIKTADARAYLSGLPAAKRAAYQALARRVDAINRDTRALLVSSGLEKQTTIDAWDAAYGDEYVPLMREEMDHGATGIGQGFSVRGSSSKRAMGSNKPVANILANIALQREKAITRAEKRRIGEALYGMVLSAPNPDFWLAVDPALQQRPSQITATAIQLISMGLNPADAQSIAAEPTQRYIDPRTGQVAERINPALRSADNVLAVRVDGEDKYVFFNAQDQRAMRMATAMKNLDADQLGTVMGSVAKVTRYFSAVNTQYNPIFGVVNLTRDVQTALLNLQSTPLKGKQAEVMKHVGSALRGIYIDLREHRAGRQPTSIWAGLFEEFQREGGATGFRDMYANAEERKDAIVSELKAIKAGTAMKVGRGIMGWLSDYNESMENAVRLSAYKVAKEHGMSNQQAASLAKNLTVNFNRGGQVKLQAGALYAFFNAATQGSARMAQTLFESGKFGKLSATGKHIIQGGLLLGSMQALLLAGAGFDDEEPPDFVRERSLVIPIGGDKYVSIPMPLGFHVIPNMARIPTEWALGGFKNTPKRIGQMIGLFADAFNPIGSAGLSLQTLTPTIIDPLAALSENRDWTGKPIAKKDFSSMKPTAGHTRAKDTATPWAKAIAYGVNIATGGTDYKPGLASPTPDQIDYLIGQATGGVGREVSKLSQVAGSTLSGEELPLYKIPLVGRFVGTTAGQAAESGRFYDNLREIGEHDAELDGLKKDRRMAEYSAYMRENPQARLAKVADRTYREVSKLNRAKRDAIKNGAGADRVKLFDQQITAKMKIFNERVKATETRETATQE